MIEDNIYRIIEERTQLRRKEGPHYEKWFKNYQKSVSTHCVKIAKQYKQHDWLEGMEVFIRQEQIKRSKIGQTL